MFSVMVALFSIYGVANALFWTWITWQAIRGRRKRSTVQGKENGRKNGH